MNLMNPMNLFGNSSRNLCSFGFDFRFGFWLRFWGAGMMLAIASLILSLPSHAQVSGQYALQPTCPSPPAPGGVICYTPETAPILRRNSQGAMVENWQNFLRQMGYFQGPTTGFYGPLTEAAMQQFQRDTGLTPDGIVGADTWRALMEANAG